MAQMVAIKKGIHKAKNMPSNFNVILPYACIKIYENMKASDSCKTNILALQAAGDF
jgi:hypothetical protein